MIRKFTLLFLLAFVVLGVKASQTLSYSWGAWDNCSVNENTIEATAAYGGAGYWIGEFDASSYDFIVVKVGNVTGKFKIYASLKNGEGVVTTSNYFFGVGASEVAINLNEATISSYKNKLVSLGLQSTEGAAVCTVLSVTLMTSSEYSGSLYELGLGDSDLNTGWKGGSDTNDPSYSSKVITWGDGTYQGKGWYLKNGDDNANFSDFSKVVVDFGGATPCGGILAVQYSDNTYSNQSFETGATSVCVNLEESKKSAVTQIYLQNAEANKTFTLKRVYAASANYFVLDERVTSTLNSQSGSYVVLYKSLKPGWNTICLPFATTADNIATGAEVYTYTSSTNEAITLTKVDGGDMTAGTPYMLYITGDAPTSPITFTDVNVTATTAGAGTTANDLTFKGNFTAGMSMSDKYGLVNDGSSSYIRHGGTNATLPAFAAYFEGTKPSQSRGFSIMVGDGTTNIDTFYATEDEEDGPIYNLMGQNTNAVGKGIYIKNGKKYIAK